MNFLHPQINVRKRHIQFLGGHVGGTDIPGIRRIGVEPRGAVVCGARAGGGGVAPARSTAKLCRRGASDELGKLDVDIADCGPDEGGRLGRDFWRVLLLLLGGPQEFLHAVQHPTGVLALRVLVDEELLAT